MRKILFYMICVMGITFGLAEVHTHARARREEPVAEHSEGSENSREFDTRNHTEEDKEYHFFVVSAEKDFDIEQISRLEEVQVVGSFTLSSMFIRLRVSKNFDISIITRMQGVQHIEKEEAYKKIF